MVESSGIVIKHAVEKLGKQLTKDGRVPTRIIQSVPTVIDKSKKDTKIERKVPDQRAKNTFEGWAIIANDGFVHAQTGKRPTGLLNAVAKRCTITVHE
jgi:hypothetical protein